MELLAPAGERQALIAAVQNGADAVYLGLDAFSARQGAANFDAEGLKDAVRYCHLRRVRVYVALNTLVRNDEWDRLDRALLDIVTSGADAMIVQDIGVAAYARARVPMLPLHASTQMTVHNVSGALAAKALGFERVVLAREVTLDEMTAIAGTGMPCEVFVHGALCSAVSGQCLLSSLIGGRSGNRGRCAQPCRLMYKNGGKEGYLLSLKDLMTLDKLPLLREAGVSSLKIEGRVKRSEYVAEVTRIYRNALDEGVSSKADVEALKQMFHRGGFTQGFAFGDNRPVYPQQPNHLGVRVGRMVKEKAVYDAPILSGDALDQRGTEIYRLVSQSQMEDARGTMRGEHRGVMVDAVFTARLGAPMRFELMGDGERVCAEGDIVQPAQNRSASLEDARAQLEKFGDTVYRLGTLNASIDEGIFLPKPALNALRRQAAEALDEKRLTAFLRYTQPDEFGHPPILMQKAYPAGKTKLVAEIPHIAWMAEALARGADEVRLTLRDFTQAGIAAALDALDGRADTALIVPAYLPDETRRRLDALLQGRQVRLIASNIGLLDEKQVCGVDFGIPVMNSWAADALASSGSLALSPELNLAQMRDMTKHGGAFEVLLYGRLMLMLLRHCPAAQAAGVRPERPGETCPGGCRLEALVDRKGAAFPQVRLNMGKDGCTVALYNAVVLSTHKHMKKIEKTGASAFRVLLTTESRTEGMAVLSAYRALVDGREEGLEALPDHYTMGHYLRGVE